MFWIALLILLVFIAFLLVRESKRRAEWQLEYRYLSRHEAHSEKKNAASQPIDALSRDTNVAESSRFEADFDDAAENSISTNIMGRHKRPVNIPQESPAEPVQTPAPTIATLSQQAAKRAAQTPEPIVVAQDAAEPVATEDKPASKPMAINTQTLRDKDRKSVV